MSERLSQLNVMQQVSRRQFVGWALCSATVVGTAGCGTILHPERRGQPAGSLDWKIVALDAVGLLLFFVPGVIAFAVDFATGTIYLPPNQYGRRDSAETETGLVRLEMPEKRLTIRSLEERVSTHLERDIQLIPGSYRTEELADIEDFWPTAERLASG